MKKLSFTLLLALFSTLAFAQTPSTQEDLVTDEAQEIIVTPVGFDKVLSLLLFDVESSQVEIKLSQASSGLSFTTSLKTSDTEVLEMDLNDFEGGTYMLKVVAGEYTTIETIIIP